MNTGMTNAQNELVAALPHNAVASKQSQPVRASILAFLTQERQAREAANHFKRPVANATGHLTAMARLGLVVRTVYGRYQRSDLAPHDRRPANITRPSPIQDAVQARLDRPMRHSDIAELIGRSHKSVYSALQSPAESGLAVFLGNGMFTPSAGDHRPKQKRAAFRLRRAG